MISCLESQHKFYLIDASGFIFRAFHALPPLENPQGKPVGAVYGFLSMLIRLLSDHHPEKLGVIFDVSRKTFRQDLYPLYKANRPPPAPELISQFSLVRQACEAFGLPVLESEGFEADDLLASYAVAAAHKGEKVTLVSSDKDLMQLVSQDIRLWDPVKNKPLNEPEVLEKFGVPPSQVVEVQALLGDSSDHIPGVPGVGIKTASQLISTFQSLENLYAHLDTMPPSRRRELLTEYREQAFLSRELVTLRKDLPLPLPIEKLAFQGISMNSVQAFLEEQAFTSLIPRLTKLISGEVESPFLSSPITEAVPQREAGESSWVLVQDLSLLEQWIDGARRQGWVAFDLETTSLEILKAEIVGVSLALGPSYACYIPLTHETTDPQIPLAEALALLRPLLEDSSILKIGHNLKYDSGVLENYGLKLTPFDDTLLLSYVLRGGEHPHNLDFLAQQYLNYQTISYQAVTGTGKNARSFREVPLEEALAYGAEDAAIALRLWLLFRKELQVQKNVTLYERVERSLVPVLVGIERSGIHVDIPLLQKLSHEFGQKLELLTTLIHEQAGIVFNIASPKQLGEVLFERLNLPGGKKGKTGAYGTASDVLEALAQGGHTLAEKILEWRGLAKLKNTYTDALPLQVNPKTGRIHTSFVMAGTSTGRLASTNPNLQNIPIRTEEGKAIRRAFTPTSGNLLASFDYSQIELRLLAHMGDVRPLIDAFQKGLDIHKETASQLFGIPLEEVTSDLRRRAKTINFGIIYGMSPFGLGERLGIPTKEAARYMEAYFAHYQGIQAYMEKTKQEARDQGFVETLWGRRCWLSGIHDRKPALRHFAERQAINAPLQGTAADFIKSAMIRIHHFLKKEKTATRMVLQIHDELLFEGPLEELKQLSKTFLQQMMTVAQLQVPLVVDWGIGQNWEEAH